MDGSRSPQIFQIFRKHETQNSKLKKEKTLPATQISKYIEHHVNYQRFSCTHSFEEELTKNTKHI